MDKPKKYNAQSIPARHDSTDHHYPVEESSLEPVRDFVNPFIDPSKKKQSKMDAARLRTAGDQLSFASIDIAGSEGLLTASIPLADSYQRHYEGYRRKFLDMRKIAGGGRFVMEHRNLVFYRQAKFMESFTDDFDAKYPFVMDYPYYQVMSEFQLRTYFTWRTKFRSGVYEPTHLSYVILLIYELLNQIGVASPEEGLRQILLLREHCVSDREKLDYYLIPWFKDYYVFYPMEQSFHDFITEQGLTDQYPTITIFSDQPVQVYAAVNALAKYKLSESTFFKGNERLILGQFYFLWKRLLKCFAERGSYFYSQIFYPMDREMAWIPFTRALFYPVLDSRDREIKLSLYEIYELEKTEWTYRPTIATEKGVDLLSAILRELEMSLRTQTNYKHKLKGINRYLTMDVRKSLESYGVDLPVFVQDAVRDFELLRNRTVVRVSKKNLHRIRDEAMKIQDRLSIEEGAVQPVEEGAVQPVEEGAVQPVVKESGVGMVQPVDAGVVQPVNDALQVSLAETAQLGGEVNPFEGKISDLEVGVGNLASEGLALGEYEPSVIEASIAAVDSDRTVSPWAALRSRLTAVEIEALRLLLAGESLRPLVTSISVMLEVFLDQINEKAVDSIGDALIESSGDIYIYDDYIDEIKEMLGE